MEPKKNREWVKNAAIIFLAVLLVLTFFSNTIMNRSLPEVATQNVTSGSIVARVRGTGVVTAVGASQVKADKNREIRSVLVKVGQKVEPGDVLFTLGAGTTEEIEAAEEKLRTADLDPEIIRTIRYQVEKVTEVGWIPEKKESVLGKLERFKAEAEEQKRQEVGKKKPSLE